MRKVHLISVTEPLVLDLALALREKGYEVSASGCGLTEEMIGRLHNGLYLLWGWVVSGEINKRYSLGGFGC